MGFYCSDVLALFANSKIRLSVVGGERGMGRVVRWVYVADTMDNLLSTLNWITGSELIVLCGSNIVGNPEDVLTEYLKRSYKKGIAGMVVNTGKYIPEIPEAVIREADRLEIPLMVVPWETRFSEFTKNICTAIVERSMEEESTNALAEYLLFGHPLTDSAEMSLTKYGFDKSFGYLVAILDVKSRDASSMQSRMETRLTVESLVKNAFERERQVIITTKLGESIVVILRLPDDSYDCKNTYLSINKEVSVAIPSCSLFIGIGKPCRGLETIPQSFQSAQQVIRFSQFTENCPITSYRDIGIYALLLSLTDETVMRSYYNDLFTPLIEYDKSNGTSLMGTLQTYIEYNCSVVHAAKALYVHENTLKYRLGKIRSLISVDLSQLEDQSRISIGLKIGKILGRTVTQQ